MNFTQEIKILLILNNPIIYIETEEEDRLEYIIRSINEINFKKKVCTWNFIDGYLDNPNYLEDGKKNPLRTLEIIMENMDSTVNIFLLKDFYNFINDLGISRKLKNIYGWLKSYNKHIIISGKGKNIPQSLREYIKYIKLPLPGKKEIQLEVERFGELSGGKFKDLEEHICNAYAGLTLSRIRESIAQIITNNLSKKQIIRNILREKAQFVEQTNILEFHYSNKYSLDIGGLQNLKNWLEIRQLTFTAKASIYGIKIPKGVILVGIQGTGKSLSAKFIAADWKLPLLKLDVSKIFAGILGESENRIKQAIDTCTRMSPCILWIDEIDKIFTEQTNNTDSGTTIRVTNIFLTWLSERREHVFVIATANNISHLPIEMLRKGRFDEIFFVDLPNLKQRIKIFQIHLKKIRPLTWFKYNIYYLGKISKKFSGAEIEQSIAEGMYRGFSKKREFTTLDVVEALQGIIPLAITEEKKITKLRAWGYSGKIQVA